VVGGGGERIGLCEFQRRIDSDSISSKPPSPAAAPAVHTPAARPTRPVAGSRIKRRSSKDPQIPPRLAGSNPFPLDQRTSHRSKARRRYSDQRLGDGINGSETVFPAVPQRAESGVCGSFSGPLQSSRVFRSSSPLILAAGNIDAEFRIARIRAVPRHRHLRASGMEGIEGGLHPAGGASLRPLRPHDTFALDSSTAEHPGPDSCIHHMSCPRQNPMPLR
jgi:hypothetical protein